MDDRNQKDGGAWIVAIDHLDDPASSVLLHSFNFGNLKDSPLCKFPKERRRPDHPDDHLQQSLLLRPLDFGHLEDRPLCK